MKQSRLELTVAGTKEAVLMIEGAADFLPEALMLEAVAFGHDAIKVTMFDCLLFILNNWLARFIYAGANDPCIRCAREM